MTIFAQFQFFTLLDLLAVVYLVLAWGVLGHVIENPPASRVSTSLLVAQYRRDWMVHMISRKPRIFDATVLATLREGTSFLASACLIAIGGGLAAMSNAERLRGVAADLSIQAPEIIWEVKILLPLFFVTNGFLKFIWSNRVFGYCGVVMASVSNDEDDPQALPRAQKAGELNITAAKAFNSGLRCIYFGLGALTWLLGPVGLLLGTTVAIYIMLRREFFSQTRSILMREDL
ncbi:DUF599 domain-containing protein [Celeribacter indicus]|uniref:DUF599 domain-containing protein n=1 Tax=Celeribacter indicus TaxID=1208324 RepID=A0A0B5DXM1_9RHOB|nr:DUF599 domain-containing protein [Celeribacter indicus]AJE45496.1 hypothetical protein P73_0781 [Celeribacter indicus]SDW87545.1 Uncharacterized membrane protein [Celeribacter indicus]